MSLIQQRTRQQHAGTGQKWERSACRASTGTSSPDSVGRGPRNFAAATPQTDKDAIVQASYQEGKTPRHK